MRDIERKKYFQRFNVCNMFLRIAIKNHIYRKNNGLSKPECNIELLQYFGVKHGYINAYTITGGI
jgi:hypothetical protein